MTTCTHHHDTHHAAELAREAITQRLRRAGLDRARLTHGDLFRRGFASLAELRAIARAEEGSR